MSCLPSLIPSLAWGHLPILVAKLCSSKHQSQSTTPMAIPFSQAGGTRLDHASGTSPLTAEAAQVAFDNALPQLPIPLTTKAAHVAVDEASHLPQLPIPPPPPRALPADVLRNPRNQKWRRKLTRSCHAAAKQSRHICPRRCVTFSLPPSHIDKDSTV